MCAKGFVRLAKGDRHVEHAAETLPDEEMPFGRRGSAGGLVDLVHELVIERTVFRQAVRPLEFPDRRRGRLAEGAVEVLRREIAHRREDVLHPDEQVAWSVADPQDA